MGLGWSSYKTLRVCNLRACCNHASLAVVRSLENLLADCCEGQAGGIQMIRERRDVL